MNNEFYQISGLNIQEEMPIKLWQTYSDADLQAITTPGPSGIQPGMIKFVNASMGKYTGELKGPVLVHGPAFVVLCVNRNGSALAQGAFARWQDIGGIAATGGSTTTATFAATGTFAAGQLVGLYCTVYDDGGGAGAAPEGETRQIIKNTTTSLTVQPAFSAAVANGDSLTVHGRSAILASAATYTKSQCAGVVLAPDGIADDYWGWLLCWGRCTVLGKAATAITAGQALIADAGRVTVSAAQNDHLIVGRAVTTAAADSVSDFLVADIDVMTFLATHS